MTGTGMRETFAEVATQLLDEDLSVAVVLADISAQLFEPAARAHPDRVINVGIREQLAINVGAGLALTGMRPIVHTFASFLIERSFEQIKLGFSHQDLGGVLVSAGASYDITAGGRTHQSPADVLLIDSLPDWEIHVPGHPDELSRLLSVAVAGDGRSYLRTTTARNRQAYPIGGFHVVTRGRRATVVAVGPMLDPVLEATRGLDVTVLYASTVRPFDAAGLVKAVGAGSGTGSAEVVLVEPYAEGTSAWCVSAALQHLPHRLLSVGVPRQELRRYGSPKEHQAAYGLDAAGLRGRISSFLEQRVLELPVAVGIR